MWVGVLSQTQLPPPQGHSLAFRCGGGSLPEFHRSIHGIIINNRRRIERSHRHWIPTPPLIVIIICIPLYLNQRSHHYVPASSSSAKLFLWMEFHQARTIVFEIPEILNRISECEIMGKPTVLLCNLILIHNPKYYCPAVEYNELNTYRRGPQQPSPTI